MIIDPLDHVTFSSEPASKRLWIVFSITWALTFLFASMIISVQLVLIREFALESLPEAHNGIHWFRGLAFFWFHDFLIFPSFCVSLVICAMPFLRRRSTAGWLFFGISLSLLMIGIFAIQEDLTKTHQIALLTRNWPPH